MPAVPSSLAELVLARRPPSRDASLRAWDGADALLVEQASGRIAGEGPGGSPVLVVNDAFGAVTVALAAMGGPAVTSWGDSHVAWLATQDNLRANAIAAPVRFVPSVDEPAAPGGLVLLRVPRSVALLRHQVAVIARSCPGATVLAAGMDKHLPEGTRSELEALGVVTTHPGARRAHVFEVVVDEQATGGAAARASSTPTITVPGLPVPLEGGVGVFSHERLDLGARVLVEALHEHGLPDGERVLDLGCGNGVLGCVARVVRPGIDLTMVDESYEAVAVAARNHERVATALIERGAAGPGGALGPVTCRVDDGLTAHDGPPFDVILCNPPFHQQHVVDDAAAWSMLSGARRHLAPGGTVVVVANRHLGWHARLRRLFASVHQVADHPKFVVLAAHGEGMAQRPPHRTGP